LLLAAGAGRAWATAAGNNATAGGNAVAGNPNVVVNGDLSKGSGESPDHWQGDGWQNGPEFTTYTWHHSGNGPGELEISNLKGNDARWIQKLHLGPGWYHFTASMRAEGVPSDNTGGNLSIIEDGMISDQVHGNTDWTPVGFYLKVGAAGADVVLGCRAGGFAALNTGKVFCRDVKGVKVAEPPADTNYKYDLDTIRNVSAEVPAAAAPAAPGTAGTGQVTLLFMAALVVLFGLFASRGGNGTATEWLEKIRRAMTATAPRRVATAAEKSSREIELALFLVCMITFAWFYQASDHSTASRIDLIRSLLERRSLWIDGFAGYNTADIVQLNGHIYSNKAPGGAFTGLIPWTFITTLLEIGLSPAGGFYWAFATYLVTIVTVSLAVAMMAVLVYRFALLLGASSARGVAMGLTLAFGTIMFPYATEFTSEPIAALCEFAAFYLLALPQNEDARWWHALFPGLLAGWGVLCDYPTFLLAATVGGYALWRLKGWGKILTFIAGAIVVADLLMLYNKFAFNSPFFLSYEAYMLPGSDRFAAQAKGFAGVTYPKLSILWDITLDPQRGLFFCNPVLLLVIPALYYFWRREDLRPEFAVVAFALIAMTLLNASYGDSIVYWGGGTAVGPRHFVPVLPFAVLAMAFLPARLNPLLCALGLVSVFIMLMATATEPHLPYEYANPFRDFVWPAYLRGDLAYNKSTYFAGPPIAGDSVAFNFGKLVGLPGWLQLWPLGAAWIAGAVYLLRNTAPARGTERRNLEIGAAIAIAAMFVPPTLGPLIRPSLNQPHGLLGCYYEGLRPNGDFPPHIRRVDSDIDFDDIVSLGSLPSPSAVIWRGKIIAPADGDYRFFLTVDDLGWLKIDGKTVIADPGDVSKPNDTGSVHLGAGEHSIETGERNIWGTSSMHLQWQPPGQPVQIVPAQALVPDTSECHPG
jgi:hypothetical protein